MAQNLQTNELITCYLLGELREPELSRVEDEFFTHDDFYTLVLDKEDELIESYLRDGLSGHERAQFEKAFLRIPERRRKVAIYKALIAPRDTTRSQHRERPSPWQSLLTLLRGHKLLLQTALPLLALLSLASFGYYLFNRPAQVVEDARRIDRTAHPVPSAQPVPEKTAEPAPTAQMADGNQPQNNSNESAAIRVTPRHVPRRTPRKSNEPSPPSIETSTDPQMELAAVATLLPSVVRGAGDQNILEIVPGSTTVNAKILLAADTYRRYRAVLRTQGGEVVWRSGGLKARQVNGKGVLVLQMPVSALSQKYYRLDLQGADGGGRSERVNYYPFTVKRN
jgi:hypothetical protein